MALQFLPEGGVALSIHAVKIKNVLGDINADTPAFCADACRATQLEFESNANEQFKA